MSQLIGFGVANLFHIIIALFYILSTVLVSNGFKLKLVHIDSPNSPFYQPNLSTIQRLQRDSEISYSRASYFEAIATNKVIQLPSIHYGNFVVEIGLGTPAVNKTLVFDTGGHLTWTQCSPCATCFKEDPPLYVPTNSSSFKKMKSNHTLSSFFNCSSNQCSYTKEYMGEAITRGFPAIDTFTFSGESIGHAVFGCGTHNIGFKFPSEKYSGVLGMNKSPLSLVRQLGYATKNRFSYCIPPLPTTHSYVTFGHEATITSRNVQSSRFMWKGPYAGYRLNLIGLRVNGKVLRSRIQRITFEGGCIIDTGSPTSYIKQDVFNALIDELVTYFMQLKSLERHVGGPIPRELCYRRNSSSFVPLPNMTFQSEGANLGLPASSLFLHIDDIFCLDMIGTPSETILGSFQQQNVRFLYDIGSNILSFAHEDCSENTT